VVGGEVVVEVFGRVVKELLGEDDELGQADELAQFAFRCVTVVITECLVQDPFSHFSQHLPIGFAF
jgi:hypothetical protein